MEILFKKNSFWLRYLLVMALFITACAKENDDDLTDARDKFTGSWTCKETDNTGVSTSFSITFEKFGVADSMRITNFAQLGNNVKALVLVNGNALSFPNQTVDNFSLTNGTGNYANLKITMSYKLDNDSYTAECKR
ncbi:MAG: hypothetical protein JNL47_09755 [Bacteroidia bacterium]|nr:hypothetical protein [Bacteroidia bacterium]